MKLSPPKSLPPGCAMHDGKAYLGLLEGSPLPPGFYDNPMGLVHQKPEAVQIQNVEDKHPRTINTSLEDGGVVGTFEAHFPGIMLKNETFVATAMQGTDAVCIGAAAAYHANRNGDVAVSDEYYYYPMESCPRGATVWLLSPHGISVRGTYDGKTYWKGWFPMPKERK